MRVGERVESHPATDAWMMGDRFGTITKITRKYVHVEMDRSAPMGRCERSSASHRLLTHSSACQQQ